MEQRQVAIPGRRLPGWHGSPCQPGSRLSVIHPAHAHGRTRCVERVRAAVEDAVRAEADHGGGGEIPGEKLFVAQADAVARGDYPLYHYLYVACRPHESIRGTMFVTHLTSDRGQRQVERAGYLPARHPMREIALTTHPLGKTGR